MQIERVPIDSISPDPANVRKHPEKNLDAIKSSLRRFGQQKPIVVDANGIVRAGNGTLEAAKALGWTEIGIVRTELKGSEATAFAIADNRTGELADWNEAALFDTLRVLECEIPAIDLGFTVDEVKALQPEEQPSENSDVIPEPPSEAITKRGDVWIMDRHRLVCGDCRDSEDVQRSLPVKTSLTITSPPYASQRKYEEGSGFEPIQPDHYVEWFAAVQSHIASHMNPDASFMLNIKEHCENGQRVLYVKDLVLAFVRQWGWRFVDEFCWPHGGTPKAVHTRFKNGWEPIFQFTRGAHRFFPDAVAHKSSEAIDWHNGHPAKGQGNRGIARLGISEGMAGLQGIGDAVGARSAGAVGDGRAYPSNVIGAGKNRAALGHPAAYPVALPKFFIKAYSQPSDVVYDPFTGSGSTLIACEEQDRRFCGIEISPRYCDIIVNRWEKFTGKTARRESA